MRKLIYVELKIKMCIDLNGERQEDIKEYLEELPRTLSGNGDLTGFFDSTIEDWSSSVTIKKPTKIRRAK